MARRFADEVVRPAAEGLDRDEAFPEDICLQMGELGLLGVSVPAEHGGAGGDAVAFVEVMEELSRGYSSVADQCGLVELLASLLARHGDEGQIGRWMGPLLDAKAKGAFCVTEAEAGSDVNGIQAVARRDGDEWVLDGAKRWIQNGPICDVAFVLARTDPDKGRRGMSVFVVDCSLDGVRHGASEGKMGQRASQVGSISFEGVRLGPETLLGEEGRGFHTLMAGLDRGRVGIASLSVGIAQAALEACVEWAKERRQFGRAIAEFQAIQLIIADMAKDVEAARQLTRMAASRLDSGEDATAACSMAKCFASDMAVAQTANAVQVHGGAGYIRGSEVERLYRDAKITELYEGTSEIQRLVIARKLLV